MPSVSASSIIATRRAPRLGRVPSARDQLTHLLDQHLASAFGARKAGEVRMHPARDLHARRATLASRRRARAALRRGLDEPIFPPRAQDNSPPGNRSRDRARVRTRAHARSRARPSPCPPRVGPPAGRREKDGREVRRSAARSFLRLPRTPSSGISGPPTRSTAIKISVLTAASSCVGVDDRDPGRLGARDSHEALAHAAMEFHLLALKTVVAAHVAARAGARAHQADLNRTVQYDRERGPDTVAGEPVKLDQPA